MASQQKEGGGPADDELPTAVALGTILVVDDDESNRDLLARRLERRGHVVSAAEGGRAALEMLAARPFDLVLLDVMMPEMSGLEVLTELRGPLGIGPSELPVIMATARNQSEDIVEALRMGANDYVTKPLDFPVVLARVQTQLTMKRAVDEAARLERSLADRNRELESLNARLRGANRRMGRDLKAAARVQEAFLPGDPPPALPGARFAWVYRPCDELAGDGLNAFPLDATHAGFYVFDVCGHGVASALLSVSLSRVLSPPADQSSVLSERGEAPGDAPRLATPSEVAGRLNAMFPFDQADQYVTMVYAILDGSTCELRYVSAGHPGLACARVGEPATVVDGRGFPVGLATGPYLDQTLALGRGDRVFFYSDGITEALDGRGEVFGVPRLLEAIERGRALPLDAAVNALVDEVMRWCGPSGPRDDVSLLAVDVEGLGP